MRLYLDDDTASPLLVRLLGKAGHDVEIPADAGLRGEDDAVHLTYAIRVDRCCLSHNYADFRNLHNLILQAQGHHPAILVVRRDNDAKRDLSASGIVRAIRNLLAAGVSLKDEYHILNHWR